MSPDQLKNYLDSIDWSGKTSIGLLAEIGHFKKAIRNERKRKNVEQGQIDYINDRITIYTQAAIQIAKGQLPEMIQNHKNWKESKGL